VFDTKGYKTTFLYGGHGYFDNMNEFFSSNGYSIIDETNMPDDAVTFSNAWGVSDEDLFNTTIKAANRAEEQGTPFFFHLMTTSNHRPYSYPSGRIDIPSGTGRNGAVKYTDWAIGDFIAKAKKTTWFKNTVFVIVADHCAGSAGKTALPINKYHIPLFIYSPAHFSAKRIQQISSQIDIAPTLLALLKINYHSYAFGKDILSMHADEERALIGNYQHLGLYKKGKLAILSPQKKISKQINPETENPTVMTLTEPDTLTKEAIAYYQGASYIYHHRMNGLENQ
jgi:phosphoglycerol transferase MdoB-like AlkP superfamily enzyme